MTPHTPRIAILLHKRRRAIKRVSALCAEEVADVPLGAARDNDLAFDRRLAAFATWREELVKVEMAVEAGRLVAIFGFEVEDIVGCFAVRDGDRVACLAGGDAVEALAALLLGLRVKCDEFEVGVAFVADEAGGVETFACCAEDAAGDWEGTVSA